MLTIGKVAKKAELSTDTIRHYEHEGLILPAQKSRSGYRLYTDEAVRRLGFIKYAQQCGFSLREIRELLELRSDDRACCDDAYRVAVQKKLQLEGKIKALQAMSRALSGLIEICSHDRKSLDKCPILSALEAGIAKQRGVRTKTDSRKRAP
jgi:DNA-binding transcriptional MerR regulator